MTAFLTVLAMSAFAANSVLCRMALAGTAIDPASFTLIRLASGAVTSGLGYVIWYSALRGLKRRARRSFSSRSL